jgi:coiled-coil domain-containing protein 130
MPFAIWCTGCPRETLIPQGVRFNAEKKRVGSYFSSPIFAFRMRHTACGNTLEIRTDPKNTAYVVTEGARKKDTGEDRPTEGVALQFRTDEERDRLRNDAFAALEVKIDDRKQAKADQARIAELQRTSRHDWDDPYAANQNLRRSFRVGRKARAAQAGRDEALQDRMSLGIQIAEETNEDRRRAKEVEFGAEEGGALKSVRSKGMFTSDQKRPARSKKESLQQELGSNTRAAVDPFTAESSKGSREALLPGLKRKRRRSPPASESESGNVVSSLVNVDYDSD